MALVLAWTLGASVSSALADAIWLERPTGSPLFGNVRIDRIEAGRLVFIVAGNESSRELAKVARIAVDDEPALTSAEEAFAAGRWDEAVDGYEKATRATTRAWVRQWAGLRLAEAASRSGRFDAAVGVYVSMILKDPSAAARAKPASFPPAGSSYLDTAVGQVNQALSTPRLGDAQRAMLLSFLVELHAARADETAANAATARLDEVLARDPNNPAAAEANLRRRLQSAQQAVDAGQYAEAVRQIDTDRAIFVDSESQAEAMFLLARAAEGLAGDATADAARATAQKDAALAYLRVVAHFREVPVPTVQARVAEALARAAALCEALGDRDGAARLYVELAGEHAGVRPDLARQARAAADRLGAAVTPAETTPR